MAGTIVKLIDDEDALQQSDPTKDVLVDDINIAFWSWGYYSTLSSDCCYLAAQPAGEKLAEQLAQLMDNGAIDRDPSRIHLIGYSDGGYVCAVCGQSIVTSGRGRIGQLTGLDVPARVLLPPVVHVIPGAFAVVTWYPLVGLDPVVSLALDDPNFYNVYVEEVTANFPDVWHGNFPDWYVENKIVRGKWDSYIAVKPQRGDVPVYTQRATFDISYSLKCQGLVDPNTLAEPASEANTTQITEIVDLPSSQQIIFDRRITSGSPSYLSEASISCDGSLFPCNASWHLLGQAFGVSGGYALAQASVDSMHEITVDWPWDDGVQRDCQGTPAWVLFGGTVDQHLRWSTQDRTLSATGSDLAYDRRVSLITVGPARDVVTVTSGGRTQTDATGLASSPIPGADYFVLDSCSIVVGAVVLPFQPRLRPYICPPKTNACVWSAYGPTSQPLAPGMQESAETIWGLPLTFDSGSEAGLCFTPETPGLYVIRNTLTSLDDHTSAGSNVAIFVPGKRE